MTQTQTTPQKTPTQDRSKLPLLIKQWYEGSAGLVPVSRSHVFLSPAEKGCFRSPGVQGRSEESDFFPVGLFSADAWIKQRQLLPHPRSPVANCWCSFLSHPPMQKMQRSGPPRHRRSNRGCFINTTKTYLWQDERGV